MQATYWDAPCNKVAAGTSTAAPVPTPLENSICFGQSASTQRDPSLERVSASFQPIPAPTQHRSNTSAPAQLSSKPARRVTVSASTPRSKNNPAQRTRLFTTRANSRSREGGYAEGAGVVSGCRRQRRRERGFRGRDVCFARFRKQRSDAARIYTRVLKTESLALADSLS
jgi:hypothetical protein